MTATLRTAAQQALEALEHENTMVDRGDGHWEFKHALAAAALRAALAEHFCDTHCTWADHAPGCVRAEPVQESVQEQRERELNEVLTERDDAEDYIDALLDEVLGPDRAEWSSAYGRADALAEVRERIAQMLKPSIDKAWNRFEAALEQQAEPVQEPVAWRYQDARGNYRYRGYVQGFDKEYSLLKPVPLYTAPPQRKPLTDEDIDRITVQQWGRGFMVPAAGRTWAREIEKAHGIGEQG